MNNELEGMRKEVGVVWFQELSPQLQIEIKETHR
jgi:hypothetical protein